jgi:oligopeptide/dipeptide ABC transporter ATP-binding protein
MVELTTAEPQVARTRSEVPLLSLVGLNVKFAQSGGNVHAVRGVSLDVFPNETLAVVGESGSGKSTTGLAAMGLIEAPGYVTGGEIWWKGARTSHDTRRSELAALRGRGMAMIFQEPGTAFNPRLTIGRQMTEGMRHHLGLRKSEARKRACELLDRVGIVEPHRRLKNFPHQFSGGMLQRVAIAMALTCGPELIIADEPTTALDVTVQAHVLALLDEVKREFGLSIVLITHDLGVVGEYAQRVAIMYAGAIVERGQVADVFAHPRHPYTAGLLASTPVVDARAERLRAIPGSPPDMAGLTAGCAFAPRCPQADDRCLREAPVLQSYPDGRSVACWRCEPVGGGHDDGR